MRIAKFGCGSCDKQKERAVEKNGKVDKWLEFSVNNLLPRLKSRKEILDEKGPKDEWDELLQFSKVVFWNRKFGKARIKILLLISNRSIRKIVLKFIRKDFFLANAELSNQNSQRCAKYRFSSRAVQGATVFTIFHTQKTLQTLTLPLLQLMEWFLFAKLWNLESSRIFLLKIWRIHLYRFISKLSVIFRSSVQNRLVLVIDRDLSKTYQLIWNSEDSKTKFLKGTLIKKSYR